MKNVIMDEWATVEEAIQMLGGSENWRLLYDGKEEANFLSYVNKNGGNSCRIRIFNGNEHPEAKKDMIVVNTRGFESALKKYN